MVGAVSRVVGTRDQDGRPARVGGGATPLCRRGRRGVGRAHQSRTHPALVPADHRRAAPRRALPVHRQRRRHDHAVRSAARVGRHLGTRRVGELADGHADAGGRRHRPRARARRPRGRRVLGPVRSGCGRRRLGHGADGAGRAPHRRLPRSIRRAPRRGARRTKARPSSTPAASRGPTRRLPPARRPQRPERRPARTTAFYTGG